MNDPWHYPREELAERVLGTLVHGPVPALSLFAPRRAGKTEFLIQDLAPFAEARGHRVVYASFWQAPLQPIAVLLHALEGSLGGATLADRLRSALRRTAPKLKLSASVPGTGTKAEAEIDLSRLSGELPTDLLLHLDDLLGRVSNPRKPAILLLDEVQELARGRHNAPLVAALRTSLDKRRNGIATVFTGSSRTGLTNMFSDREAPFFHYATPIDLPGLGPTFVEHILAVFRKTARRALDPDEMGTAFEQLNRNPYFFRLLVQTLLQDAESGVSAALVWVRERISAELGYPSTWLSLSPIQRETARGLAAGVSAPFGRAFRSILGSNLGEETPTPARVQAALRRLERLGIAEKTGGRWELADTGFQRWITAGDDDAGDT